AGPEWLEAVGGAQFRNLCACQRGSTHNGASSRHSDGNAINFKGDGLIRNGFWCPQINVGNGLHKASYGRFNSSTLSIPKSFGKCFSALSTGKGISPPRPQSEPFNMTSHKSRNRWRFAFRFRFWIMRSITSTPRVDPMRHGVHFPQDSRAQNSI